MSDMAFQTMKSDRKIYVVVRTDLPPYAIVPQACHAVAELGRNGLIRHDEEHPIIVVLGVPSLDELRRVFVAARKLGIRCRYWVESDLGNLETALATEAIPATMREPFKKLSLLCPATKVDPRHSEPCGLSKDAGHHFSNEVALV